MRYLRLALAGLMLAVLSAAAAAEDRPLHFFLAGGYPIAMGPTADFANGEWGLTGGVNYDKAGWPVGLQFDGMTYRFGYDTAQREFIAGDGHLQVTAGTADVVWQPTTLHDGAIKPRVITGVGFYFADFHNSSVGTSAGAVNRTGGMHGPHGPTGVPVTGNDTETAFGVNVGGNIGFAATKAVEVFVQARLHCAFTAGDNTVFLPFDLGVRW